MQLKPSNKFIVLTKNADAEKTITDTLQHEGLARVSELHVFSSLPSVQNQCRETGSTAFIRTGLVRFTRDYGFPRVIAADFRINTLLGSQSDPDQVRVLRSFLLSYIILSRAKGFENLKACILILFDEKDAQYIQHYEKNPEKFLDLLRAKDETVNAFITEMKENQKKFNTLFFFKCVSAAESHAKMSLYVFNFFKAAQIRDKARVSTKMTYIDRSDTPGDIVYAPDYERVYINGSPAQDTSQYPNLQPKIIYIHGAWTNKTLMTVSERLSAFVLKGADDIEFDCNVPLVIDIGDMCTVDGTTVPSILQTLTRDLSEYKKVRIQTNEKNYAVLAQTAGFQLIRRQIAVE